LSNFGLDRLMDRFAGVANTIVYPSGPPETAPIDFSYVQGAATDCLLVRLSDKSDSPYSGSCSSIASTSVDGTVTAVDAPQAGYEDIVYWNYHISPDTLLVPGDVSEASITIYDYNGAAHVGGTVDLTYSHQNLNCVSLSLEVDGHHVEDLNVGYSD